MSNPGQSSMTSRATACLPAALRAFFCARRGRASGGRVLPTLAGLLPLVALIATTAFALAATPALASQGYVPGPSFGSGGSGDGQFKEPAGVAVNDSTGLAEGAGDVYVVDKGNERVERFSPTGTYEAQFNGSATHAKSFASPEWTAIDNSGKSALEDPSVGDVYVADVGHGVIDK